MFAIIGRCQVPPNPVPHQPPKEKEKTCPPNTILENGDCRCPPGTIGVPPICLPQGPKKEKPPQQQEEACPSGYRKLNKPNKYGALCEPIDQGPPPCPADRPNGTPPNCCPEGTRFAEGFCRSDRCSPGWTGSPPHCQPPATQQAPAPTAPPPTCKPPLIGTPPNCHCPGGYEFDPESNECRRGVQ
jgi:hypothetical protein